MFMFKANKDTEILKQKFSKYFAILWKIGIFFVAKNSWKCCGYKPNICWQLWFDEKNYDFLWKKKSWKCSGLS